MRSSTTRDYLAIDLGASSSRAILGRWNGETLALEEIMRFQREESLQDLSSLLTDAAGAKPLACLFDPGNRQFTDNRSFLDALTGWCRLTGQSLPDGTGGMVRCILESLALFLAEAVCMMGAFLTAGSIGLSLSVEARATAC